ncbi:MAG: VTT domain-containing protein [Myxococcota bacterium]|nr:VTT domain-containing protein [Myxococcota bacterium]
MKEHQILQSVRVVATSPRRWARVLGMVALMALAILLVSFFGQWLGEQLPVFEAWIRSMGWWGPAVFMAAFTLLTLLQVPESFLAIAGGVIFGLEEGIALVISSNVVAALVAFWIYRILFKQRLERMLEKHPKTHAVEAAIAAKGFKLMVLLRLGPFNYSVLNAILGASGVKMLPFLFSLVGAFPGNFATVYFGAVAKHMAQRSAGTDDLSTAHEISLVVGFVVTVIVFLFVGRVAHHAIESAEADAIAAENPSAPESELKD